MSIAVRHRHDRLPPPLAFAGTAGDDAPTDMDDTLPTRLAEPAADACASAQCLIELQARPFRQPPSPPPVP